MPDPGQVSKPCVEALWLSTIGKGYRAIPRLSRTNGERYAHRDAWVRANGRPIPDGMQVCHTCDNPPCIEPSHLWIGTNRDNALDKERKGRHIPSRMRGNTNPRTKLTEANVRAIRQLLADGQSHRVIAEGFGITYGAVGGIAQGTSWGYLDADV